MLDVCDQIGQSNRVGNYLYLFMFLVIDSFIIVC